MRTAIISVLGLALAACGQPAGAGGDGAAAQGGGGETAFVDACVAGLVAENAQARQWAPDECAERWRRVVAAGPMADAILAAAGGTLPTGARLGTDVAIEQARGGQVLMFRWEQVGALIPYDVVGALRERGARVEMVGCSVYGVGEFNRAYNVTPPGGRAFQLGVLDRTAPTANANSFYNVTVNLTGELETRAQLAEDGMEWTESCAY